MLEENALTLVQITDMHLQNDPSMEMKGVNPEQRFLRVLDQVAREKADLLLLTGDLTHHAPVAYSRLVNYLEKISFPSVWIPGNHDLADEMFSVERQDLNRKCIDLPSWRILLLDSTSQPDGKGGGSLSAEELFFLQNELNQASRDVNILIVLHHHPISVQSEWQDQIALGNAEEFLQIVESSAQVRGVVFGHVHQALQALYKDIPMFSAPATAAQFVPQTIRPQIETDASVAGPAYTRYRLYPSGSIEMDVCRLPA